MRKITANVSCPWFDGEKFSHSLFRNGGIVRLKRDKKWGGDEYVARMDEDEIRLSFNRIDEKFDFVVDMGDPYSEYTKKAKTEERILALTEPSVWLKLDQNSVLKMSQYYPARILGWHKELRNLGQYRFWNATSKWIGDDFLKEKKFGVSGLISNKMLEKGIGYKLRYNVVRDQYAIKIPSEVYNFTGKWQGKDIKYPLPAKDASMGYMFHLAIENVREEGYFTEKLVDCFAAKVVPLYFGAPDIGNYFDESGMIILDSKNWVDQINSLTATDFDSKKKAMELNFEKSKEYWCSMRTLAKAIWERSKE